MVFNATLKNISAISWQSDLLVEETGVPRENHRPAASHWQTLSHNVLSITSRLSGIQTHNVSICKSVNLLLCDEFKNGPSKCMLLISKEELSYTCQILLMFFLRQSDTSQSFPVWLLPYRVKVGSTAEVVLCSRCLNFFHQLVKKPPKKLFLFKQILS